MADISCMHCYVGPPAAPSGVKASGVTETTVNLQWSTGGNHGHQITSYIIEATDNYTTDWHKMKEMSVREEGSYC